MTVTPAPPNVISPEHIEEPWPGLAILREHYPVHFDEHTGSWLISRYAEVRALDRAIQPGPTFQELLGQYLADATSFLAMEGAEHRQRRRLLAPFFARGGVESFHDHIERRARGVLEPILERERQAVASGERERGEIDFIAEFTTGFTIAVMGDILGLELADHPRVTEWFAAWIAAEGNISRDPRIIERAVRAKDEFGEYIGPVIAERRGGDAEDLISQLCRAEIDGFSMPDEEIRSFAAAMLLAGGETTDHQLGWLMYELTRHPEVQKALSEDRGLMDRVLAEGMRYCSIVQYLGRTAPEDLEVDGVAIEAGAPMALVLASANHDPRRFENADEFDIYRNDNDVAKAFTGAAEHLGFGTGHHFCIGSHLSKAEMAIALNLFFDNVRDVRLADGFEPRANPEAVFVRALPALELTFELQ